MNGSFKEVSLYWKNNNLLIDCIAQNLTAEEDYYIVDCYCGTQVVAQGIMKGPASERSTKLMIPENAINMFCSPLPYNITIKLIDMENTIHDTITKVTPPKPSPEPPPSVSSSPFFMIISELEREPGNFPFWNMLEEMGYSHKIRIDVSETTKDRVWEEIDKAVSLKYTKLLFYKDWGHGGPFGETFADDITVSCDMIAAKINELSHLEQIVWFTAGCVSYLRAPNIAVRITTPNTFVASAAEIMHTPAWPQALRNNNYEMVESAKWIDDHYVPDEPINPYIGWANLISGPVYILTPTPTPTPTPIPTPTLTPTPTATPTPPSILGECVFPRIITGTLTPRLEKGVVFYRIRCIMDRLASYPPILK